MRFRSLKISVYLPLVPLILWLLAIYVLHGYTLGEEFGGDKLVEKVVAGDKIRQISFLVAGTLSLLIMVPRRWPKAYWNIFFVIMICLLSTFWSIAPEYTIRRVIRVLCLSLVILPLSVDYEKFLLGLRGILVFSIAVCTVSLGMYFFGWGIISMLDELRLQGVTPHPNALGPLAVMGIILLIILRKHRDGLFFGILIVLASTLYLTKSRSSYAALMVFVATYLAAVNRAHRFWTKTIVVIWILSLIVAISYFEIKEFGGRDYTMSGRTLLWKATLQDWATHPLLGAGFGASAVPVTGSFLAKTFKSLDWVPVHSHQEILQLFNELGVAFAPVVIAVLLFGIPYRSKIASYILLPFGVFAMVESLLFEGTVFSIVFFLLYLNKSNLNKQMAANNATPGEAAPFRIIGRKCREGLIQALLSPNA